MPVTSGMPSRTRLLLSGDPRSQVLRMSRTRLLQLGAGDPFLGGLGKILGKGLKGLFKNVVAPSLGLVSPIPPIIASPEQALPGFPNVGKIVKKGFETGTSTIMIPSPFSGAGAGVRRRRRMNPLNPRALRRALSRASAFSRFARRALHVTFGKAPKVRFRVGRRKKT